MLAKQKLAMIRDDKVYKEKSL